MDSCEEPLIMPLTDLVPFLKVGMVIDAGHQSEFQVKKSQSPADSDRCFAIIV